MNIVIIVAAIFLVLGIVQLFISFNTSLLVTIILTVIVGAMYIYTDKQCKEQEALEAKNPETSEEIELIKQAEDAVEAEETSDITDAQENTESVQDNE